MSTCRTLGEFRRKADGDLITPHVRGATPEEHLPLVRARDAGTLTEDQRQVLTFVHLNQLARQRLRELCDVIARTPRSDAFDDIPIEIAVRFVGLPPQCRVLNARPADLERVESLADRVAEALGWRVPSTRAYPTLARSNFRLAVRAAVSRRRPDLAGARVPAGAVTSEAEDRIGGFLASACESGEGRAFVAGLIEALGPRLGVLGQRVSKALSSPSVLIDLGRR